MPGRARAARPLDGVERIAVVRANGIGDLLFAMPAFDALRAAYPNASISLLGAPWHEELMRGRPGPVDEVIEVPAASALRGGQEGDESFESMELFLATMRARRFDLALQMHGGGLHSNPFTSNMRARVSAGLRAPGSPPLDLELPYVYYQSEVARLLEVVGLVGAVPLDFDPRLTVTGADLEKASAVLPPDARPLVVLNPGATDSRRRWPPERFGAVGNAAVRAGARVAVIGGPLDRELSRAVLDSMREPALDLAGRLDLGGLAGLLSGCRVLVSNDSGPLHLGAAVGAATVGIYWCGNLINAGPLFRARHRPQLAWRLECPACGVDCTRASCSHGESFVADVAEEEVAAAMLELLEATGGRAAPAVAVGSTSGQAQHDGGGGGQ
jgi:ADP-heptose:LPS heptosyltransferase